MVSNHSIEGKIGTSIRKRALTAGLCASFAIAALGAGAGAYARVPSGDTSDKGKECSEIQNNYDHEKSAMARAGKRGDQITASGLLIMVEADLGDWIDSGCQGKYGSLSPAMTGPSEPSVAANNASLNARSAR